MGRQTTRLSETGIILSLEQLGPNGFRGHWTNYGSLHGGSGTYSARRITP